MKELSEKTIKYLEIAAGIVGGLGMWGLIMLSGSTSDGLLQYAYLAWFLVLLLGGRALEKKLNRQFKKYRIALLISMGAGLLVFVALLLTGVFKV